LSLALMAAAGCDASETSDVDVDNSALTGAGGGSVPGPVTVDSPIRGYTILGMGGGSGTHAVIYRTAPNGTLERRGGTPLGAAMSMGGNLAPGSAPWAYRRGDGVEAIVYIDANRHVHEITSSGNFDYQPSPISAPLAAPAPANGPVPDVIGYVRSDGRSAVVYRGENNHVIEIISNPAIGPRWLVYDLTSQSGAQVIANKGSVFPYVRSDSYSTLIYIGSDNHIHELAHYGELAWGDGDLSAATGDTAVAPATDPWPYARSDGYNSIVYVGADGLMHELAYLPGTWWGSWLLPAVSPQAGPFMRPSGYIRGDGLNIVVYLGSDALIHQLALVNGAWSDSTIATGNVFPTSQLFGHRPPGRLGSVLFRGTNAGVVHGYELSLPSNGAWGLQEF
jgi:hypothetical protein